MRFPSLVSAALVVFTLGGCAHSRPVGQRMQDGASDLRAPEPYHVRVNVREVQHRTVECRVRDHVVRVDQPREFGADDTAPTPPELLAAALGSCVVSTMQFVAAQRGQDIRDIHVTVEGSVDFSKAVGLRTSNRAGFGGLKVGIQFVAPAMSAEEKAEFIRAVFVCGAAIDNIQNATPLTYALVE